MIYRPDPNIVIPHRLRHPGPGLSWPRRPESRIMASGGRMLDSSGRRILTPSGARFLSDGQGDQDYCHVVAAVRGTSCCGLGIKWIDVAQLHTVTSESPGLVVISDSLGCITIDGPLTYETRSGVVDDIIAEAEGDCTDPACVASHFLVTFQESELNGLFLQCRPDSGSYAGYWFRYSGGPNSITKCISSWGASLGLFTSGYSHDVYTDEGCANLLSSNPFGSRTIGTGFSDGYYTVDGIPFSTQLPCPGRTISFTAAPADPETDPETGSRISVSGGCLP
jgi:hypothetical protein